MLTDQEIREEAGKYVDVKVPLRIKDYSAHTKRVYNAFIAGANLLKSELEKWKATAEGNEIIAIARGKAITDLQKEIESWKQRLSDCEDMQQKSGREGKIK